MEKRITIQSLVKAWFQKKGIANIIWCHRNTVRNIQNENPIKNKVIQDSKIHQLDQYKDFIQSKIDQKLSLVRIHEELKSNMNYDKWYDALFKYVKTRKLKSDNAVYVVINSPPWEEAQVDFWYVWLTPCDTWNWKLQLRKTWVFVITLWYSRLAFYKTVYNQNIKTFLQCHIEAFEYFWWVPKTIKIDNLKAWVLKVSFYEIEYQPDYLEFSQYYNFKIIACKVRYPEEKGKVESWIKYVKNNFFKWRTSINKVNIWFFKNKNDLDLKLLEWQNNIANKRIHWTTKKIPEIIFNEEEKQKLLPLPNNPWELHESERRRVWRTCHIIIKWNYYSVPYKQIWNNVDIKITNNLIKIYELKNNELIATHNKLSDNIEWQYNTNNSHYPDYKRFDLRNCFNTEFQCLQWSKMKELWEHAYEYFLELYKGDRSWSRKIKWILHLEKTFWKDAINESCKRALWYGAFWYKVIENICKKWLYKDKDQNQDIYQNNKYQDKNINSNFNANTNINSNMNQNTNSDSNTNLSKNTNIDKNIDLNTDTKKDINKIYSNIVGYSVWITRPLSYYSQILINN